MFNNTHGVWLSLDDTGLEHLQVTIGINPNYQKFLIWLLSTFSNPVESHLLRVLDIPKSFIPQCRLLPKMPFPNLWAASIFKLFIPRRKYHLLKKRSCWGHYTTRSLPEISIIVPGFLLSQHLYHSHSAQFSYSVMSNSVWPPWTQHSRLSFPSPTPRACSNSYPSSRWCHPTISSSVVHFSSCLRSFPASGSFPMSQTFISGGQSTRASASVFPMNIQDWLSLGRTGWISLQSKGLSRVFNTTLQSINSSALSFLYSLTLASIHQFSSVAQSCQLQHQFF